MYVFGHVLQTIYSSLSEWAVDIYLYIIFIFQLTDMKNLSNLPNRNFEPWNILIKDFN